MVTKALMESSRSTRSILPIPVPSSAELHQLPPGVQLPSTLRMPSLELLHRLPRLASHLESVRLLALAKPTLAVTVRETGDRKYLVEWDIPRDLTDDSDLRDDLHSAIPAFIECFCPGATSAGRSATGGVGSVCVTFYTKEEAKALDTVLFSVIRIARLLQVADGNVKRLPGILRDSAVGACLMKLVGAYHFDGSPGKLVMRPTAGRISVEQSAALAQQLAEAGYLDLALIVLTGALKNHKVTEKIELAPAYLAYLSYLVTPGLLNSEQDFNAALDLIVDLLRETYAGLRSPMPAACYPFVHYLLDRNMLKEAFKLITEMHYLPWEKEAHQQDYMAVMERIVRAESLSIELGEKVYDTFDIEHMPFVSDLARELAGRLLDAKGMAAVFESPQRGTLEALGFKFTISFNDGRLVVKPDDNNVFIPPRHGAAMVEYAESLVENSQDLEHLRGFCWPVLDFLMGHLAELPAEVLQRVLVLTAKVVVEVTERSLTSPILTGPVLPTIERMQRFIEAALMQSMINGLPTLESSLTPTTKRLMALFNGGSLCGKPVLLEALLQCWKTLTSASDVECLALRIRNTRMISPAATIKLAQEARDKLQECLTSQTPDIQAALELHAELIDLVVSAARGRAEVAWATQLLAEMSSEALSSSLCLVQPNAAAWPIAGSIQILIRTEELSPDNCLVILSNCAALPGVTVDRRLSAMFRMAIQFLVDDSRYDIVVAIRAFLIRESLLPMVGAERERVSLRVLSILLETTRLAMLLSRGAGMDLQKAANSLLAEAQSQDKDTALQFLDRFLVESRALEKRGYPLLAVTLCVQFAEHFKAQNDIYALDGMVAKALTHLPKDPILRAEALEILKPFWRN